MPDTVPASVNPTVIRPNCGTSNGRQAHARKQEAPCEPCRRAHAEYQRARLARTGGPRTRQRLVNRVRAAERNSRDATVIAAVTLVDSARLRRELIAAQLDCRPHLTEHASHRLRWLAHRLDDNSRRVDSRDAAMALRYAARAIRTELSAIATTRPEPLT